MDEAFTCDHCGQPAHDTYDFLVGDVVRWLCLYCYRMANADAIR